MNPRVAFCMSASLSCQQDILNSLLASNSLVFSSFSQSLIICAGCKAPAAAGELIFVPVFFGFLRVLNGCYRYVSLDNGYFSSVLLIATPSISRSCAGLYGEITWTMSGKWRSAIRRSLAQAFHLCRIKFSIGRPTLPPPNLPTPNQKTLLISSIREART